MTFLLNNIIPSDHNSDLTLPKCKLVYNIMEHISVHVALLILDVIHQFVGTEPPKHLVDPEKSNKALRFPALITGLY